MLVLETVLRIRREFASGKAIKAISRDLRLSRKVVRKAIREPDAEFAYRRAVQPLPRLVARQLKDADLLTYVSEQCGTPPPARPPEPPKAPTVRLWD